MKQSDNRGNIMILFGKTVSLKYFNEEVNKWRFQIRFIQSKMAGGYLNLASHFHKNKVMTKTKRNLTKNI